MGAIRKWKHTHVEHVGVVRVEDSTVAVDACSKCGKLYLSRAQEKGYRFRAAAAVLRDGSGCNGDTYLYVRVEAVNLSQVRWGTLLGVSRRTVSDWEKNKRVPSRGMQLAMVALIEGIYNGLFSPWEIMKSPTWVEVWDPSDTLAVREMRPFDVWEAP